MHIYSEVSKSGFILDENEMLFDLCCYLIYRPFHLFFLCYIYSDELKISRLLHSRNGNDIDLFFFLLMSFLKL